MAPLIVTPQVIGRLKNQLMISPVRDKDNPLYQVINQLIGIIEGLSANSANGNSNVGPAGINGRDGIPGFSFGNDDGNSGIIIPGPMGANGSNGIDGSNGLQGPPGLDGLDADLLYIPGPTGPQGPQGNAGTSGVSLATVTLTDAQFRTLSSVPIQILAGQGSGTIIMPLFLAVAYNITSGFSAGVTTNYNYNGTSGPASAFTMNPNVTGKRFGNNVPASQTTSATSRENTGIYIFNNVDVTGGSSNGGFNFYMPYIILTIP